MFHEPGIIKVLRPNQYEAGISLRKRRAWYEGDPAPTPDPAPNPAPPPANTGDDKGKTFTQDDLNRIVGERAARAKEAAIADLLKELGLDSADSLKAKVKAQADAEAAQLSAVEKAEKRAADLEAKLKAAEEQAAQVVKDAQIKERNGAVKAALVGAKDASDLMILIEARMADDLAKVLKDDGAIDDKAVKELADKAKKQWPEQFKPAGPGSPSHSGGHNMDDSELDKKAREQAFRQRRRSI